MTDRPQRRTAASPPMDRRGFRDRRVKDLGGFRREIYGGWVQRRKGKRRDGEDRRKT